MGEGTAVVKTGSSLLNTVQRGTCHPVVSFPGVWTSGADDHQQVLEALSSGDSVSVLDSQGTSGVTQTLPVCVYFPL